MTTAIWRYVPGPTDAAELVHVLCAPGETAQDAAERYFIEHPNADAALAVVYDSDNRAALAAFQSSGDMTENKAPCRPLRLSRTGWARTHRRSLRRFARPVDRETGE